MRRNKRRIESKSSLTASFMCLTRAASFKDERECYNSPDNIAYELTPSFLRSIIKSRLLFKAFSRRYYAKGSYEYVIARTKYFDDAFEQALMQGFDQIVVFGAGFDSRAIRFNGINRATRIFEVDAPKTQQEKQMGLKKRSIPAPDSLVYVPIDFNKEQVAEKMQQAGFATGKKTLFTFEGVTMYLTQSGIEDTFQFISQVSAEGSILVFDHIYSGVLRGENKYFGEESMAESVAKVGENWQFGLEEGEAEQFVGKFGFSLKDNCNAQQLTERYFKNSKGEIVAKMNGTHAIVAAVKTNKKRNS